MHLYAIFVGADGSLGYRRGYVYELIVIDGLAVSRKDGSGQCLYGSLAAFLRNWKMATAKQL